MKRSLLVLVLVLASGLASLVQAEIKVPTASSEDAAQFVAKVVVAGRGVVARHQALINDAEKGDKGFTPDYMAELLVEDFTKLAGVAPDAIADEHVREVVLATIDASKECVKNNQSRINQSGIAFKGFIPAVYGRITGNILKAKTGIQIKQTTFTPRNLYNKPDAFEVGILEEFNKTKPKAGYGEAQADAYRYLQPIYIKPACLSCHGDPKGELDIAGKPKEGYKVGELRGAISVIMPTI